MHDFKPYLKNTCYLNKNDDAVIAYTRETLNSETEPRLQMVLLYNRIRDEFLYDPFKIDFSAQAMRASEVIKRNHGFCIDKALLLAACARVLAIPSRLGFADVRNHLATPRFLDLMGSNVFTYHGYTDLFLDGKWVKATPAFDQGLCQRFNVLPLEFDGQQDSVFQEFNTNNQRHMEYVRDRGTFNDLPLDEIVQSLQQAHPAFFSFLRSQKK